MVLLCDHQSLQALDDGAVGEQVPLTEWEELGWIDVQTAGVAFCSEGMEPNLSDLDSTRVVGDGYVYQATMVDCPLPVEVRQDEDGRVVEARMCFTDDVDDLQGTWARIGRLDLPEGRCVACDPCCDGPQFRIAFQLKPGRYVARVFEHQVDWGLDTLGLSLEWTEPIEGRGSTDAQVGQSVRDADTASPRLVR